MNNKILIVEDNSAFQRILGKYFKKNNYDVSMVSNGIDALWEIKDWKPDVVILDIRMKGMSGFEIFEAAREINPLIGVVMISGYSTDMETIEKAKKMGVIEFLPKPFDFEYLKKIITEKLSENSAVKKRGKKLMTVVSPFLIILCLGTSTLAYPDYSKTKVAILDFRNSAAEEEWDIMEWLIPEYYTGKLKDYEDTDVINCKDMEGSLNDLNINKESKVILEQYR